MPELNPRQREAVRTIDGPVVVVAGPGTGKTFTLVRRIAHLITEKHIPASSILALTFTRSAAREMRERLRTLLKGGRMEKEADGLWVETFHAAAARVLKEQRYPFGPDVEWSVASDAEKSACLDGLVPARRRAGLLDEVRRLKSQGTFPAENEAGEYQRRLFAMRRLDFEDLLLYASRLFDERPDVQRLYRDRFRYVMVDEFQDTSAAQYDWLRRLNVPNACVIGDPDQSIYGFSSVGDFVPFARFKEDRPKARVIALSENYRSRGAILEAAQQVIKPNRAQFPRALQTRLEHGLPLEAASHPTARQEAELIVRRIECLLGGGSYFTVDTNWARKEAETYAYGLGDIAILYRFHAQAGLLIQALDRSGLPYRVFGGKRVSEEPADPGEVDDYRNDEEGAPRGEWITLMTLHRAKGLEFPVVFIPGCEEGLLPFLGFDGSAAESFIEEERRLLYVGLTRAKNRLFLSHAKKRALFGRTREAGPSRFLRDIEEQLRVIEENRKIRPKRGEQATLFDL